MKLGLLSNENLARGLNWTLLSDSLFPEIERIAQTERIAPPPLGFGAIGRYLALARRVRTCSAVFSLKGRSRPEPPLQLLTMMGGRKINAVFYVDPWAHSIDNIIKMDKLCGTDLAFVPYREAYDALTAKAAGRTRYVYLPFASDNTIFRDFGTERDIDILSMGRRDEQLHQALLEFTEARGLNYQYREKTGFIEDPKDLGKLASRARYFVVSPPDSTRSGGFSPIVMRYFEGLAAGCRLLGTRPGSGEFERLLPEACLLEVASDGSNLAAGFDRDQADEAAWEATRQASELVREKHGWDARAKTIVAHLQAMMDGRDLPDEYQ